MEVTVRLFAVLRERAGASALTLELAEGARVADVLERLDDLAGDVPVVLAVNREYADRDTVLDAHDELALIPPLSGGEATGSAIPPLSGGEATGSAIPPLSGGEARAASRDEIARVTVEPLSLDRLVARVRDPRAGAVVIFQGVTREVERLEYEAYVEMAEERIAEVVRDAVARHGLARAAAEHRVGAVPLSEPSVAVAVSAAHRAEAFAGAREIIDRIKAEAPIWKREIDGDNERWVEGTAPSR